MAEEQLGMHPYESGALLNELYWMFIPTNFSPMRLD